VDEARTMIRGTGEGNKLIHIVKLDHSSPSDPSHPLVEWDKKGHCF
jgi:hypothetical protein